MTSTQKRKKRLFIFAGANGSGKSTLAERFLQHAKIKEFVNADSIAMGLSPFNPESQKMAAGKLVLERIDDLMNKGEDFALETTLSGTTLASRIKMARNKGYHVRLFYLHTTDIRVNLKRIKYRVSQGGHNVPAPDVRRRHKRSLRNLFGLYYKLCDTVTIWDNTSGTAELVALKLDDGRTGIIKEKQDLWLQMKKQADDNE